MDQNTQTGRRLECTGRDLLEIVVWIAVGSAALKLVLSQPFAMPHAVALFLALFPSAAYGAALGVIARRRRWMATLCFLAWTFALCGLTGGQF